MRLHAEDPGRLCAESRFGRELERRTRCGADVRLPDALHRNTRWRGLDHGAPVQWGASCGARRARRAIDRAISAWEPQYLCTPSEQHERGRNWFVVPLPVTLNENVLSQRTPRFRRCGTRGARHAAVRATLCLLALMLIPATARGRDNDIPRDGITAAIPAGWIAAAARSVASRQAAGRAGRRGMAGGRCDARRR